MTNMSSNVNPIKSKIQTYYENKSVFVTGGTGFLGKVLIEKLLRGCPSIKRVYLLVREKRGEAAQHRLNKLLDCELFVRLRHEQPDFARKITVLPGDISSPSLGLSSDHVTELSQNVEIIFHAAATIRFNEKLSVAINTNVAATKKLCHLAQKVVNLEALVYISTAYCDCDKPVVLEKVPSCRISPENLLNLEDLLGEKTLNEVSAALLGTKPNTYIFTKCAAEQVVDSFKMSLPVAVFRPSIVMSTASEPVPGWIDNVLGPTGIAVSQLAGLVHTCLVNTNATVNLVPVDYVVNGIITLGYAVGERKWGSPEMLRIVNFVSPADNSITWGRYRDLLLHNMWQHPSSKLMWYPFWITTSSHWLYVVMRSLFHRTPARVIDWLSAKIGRPTRLKKFYSRLENYNMMNAHFSMSEFNFEEGNAARLWASMDATDQRLFPFNMAADALDWDLYFRHYVAGCRRFLLNEDPATTASSRCRIKVLYVLHLVASSAVFFTIVKTILFVWRLVRRNGNSPNGKRHNE